MKVSEYDDRVFKLIRESVRSAILTAVKRFDLPGCRILDIAPQEHEGVRPLVESGKVFTLDVNPDSGADFICDICNENSKQIPDGFFDLVVCTEVLEHTLNPFLAADEIHRICRDGGEVLVTTPFDFRIHGPLPDCWRFTEHGLRSVFSKFSTAEIKPVENPDRFLMPYHYVTILKK